MNMDDPRRKLFTDQLADLRRLEADLDRRIARLDTVSHNELRPHDADRRRLGLQNRRQRLRKQMASLQQQLELLASVDNSNNKAGLFKSWARRSSTGQPSS